jgi:hypothetical protein
MCFICALYVLGGLETGTSLRTGRAKAEGEIAMSFELRAARVEEETFL